MQNNLVSLYIVVTASYSHVSIWNATRPSYAHNLTNFDDTNCWHAIFCSKLEQHKSVVQLEYELDFQKNRFKKELQASLLPCSEF